MPLKAISLTSQDCQEINLPEHKYMKFFIYFFLSAQEAILTEPSLIF